MNESNEILVFIASPSDLAPERKVFKDTIDALNAGFAEGAGVKFVPRGWEDVLASTGRRAQGVINQDIDRCDLFVLALHRRWGQPASDSKFSSYTEEEFQLALARWEKTKSPEVIVFFKNVDASSMADPGPELKKVLKFRKKLELEKKTLYKTFNTETDFGSEIDRHLRAFAKGEWKSIDQASRQIDLPAAQIANLNKDAAKSATRVKRAERRLSSSRKTEKGKSKQLTVAKADLSLVQAYETELAFARAGAEAADDGRIQDATILFSKATEATTNPSILALAAEFFRQVGDVENATRLVRRQAAITRDREVAVRNYFALLPAESIDEQVQELKTRFQKMFPPEMPPEIIDGMIEISRKVIEGEKYKKFLFDAYVKHLSTEEINHLARFLGTAEGQSSLRKQRLISSDLMNFSTQEMQRFITSPEGVEFMQRLGTSLMMPAITEEMPLIDQKQLAAAKNDDKGGEDVRKRAGKKKI